MNNKHYPIEIQVNTKQDRRINDLESFKEYYPYTMVSDEIEYISKIVKM